ncbi:MAG: AIR carboxylase family protein [Candidatus Aenigmarchaeota archaeon]|nr:AIR carboxylase family protein [Candidatus Aenigmarchaeota archaeon]
MTKLVPVIMGSRSDHNTEHNKKLYAALDRYGLPFEPRVASAHKHPSYLAQMIAETDARTGLSVVYITIAGRSDGLSGTVAANTVNPVIACPPYSDKFAGLPVLSTVYTPSMSAPMYVQDPENAALAAAKIFSMSDKELRARLVRDIIEMQGKIEEDDMNLLKKPQPRQG